VRIARAVTVEVEVAYRGTDGALHGHSLTVEVWTDRPCCPDAWKARVVEALSEAEVSVLGTPCTPLEGLAAAALDAIPEAFKAVVRLPTRGHVVECERSA
jgi:hypothetical protein